MEDQAKVPAQEHITLAEDVSSDEFATVVGAIVAANTDFAGGEGNKVEFTSSDRGMNVIVNGELAVQAVRIDEPSDGEASYNVTGDPKYREDFESLGF